MTFSLILDWWRTLPSHPSGRRIIPAQWKLDLQRRLFAPDQRVWFQACRTAVQQGDPASLEAWLLSKDKDILGLLGTFDPRHLDMMKLHLRCARHLLAHSCMIDSPLEESAHTFGQEINVPHGFLQDLLHELRFGNVRPAKAQQTIALPLVEVSSQQEKGVMVELVLELLEDGSGEVYPTPAFAFVDRTARQSEQGKTFREAEDEAQAAVFNIMHTWAAAPKRSVRWSLQRHEKLVHTLRLLGPSAGLAFSMGLLTLFARQALKPQFLVTEQERKETLSILSVDDPFDLDLEGVAFTAAVSPDGTLQQVGNIREKLEPELRDLARQGRFRIAVVAADQDRVPKEYLAEDAEPLRVLKAKDIKDVVSKLHEVSRSWEAVRTYEEKACAAFDILGKPVAIESYYQTIPLLREITREKLPRRKRTQGTTRGDQDFQVNGDDELKGANLLRWEEALQEEHRTYEEYLPDDLLTNFQRFVKPQERNHTPRLVVIGPPGSGKTSLTKHLGWRAAKGEHFTERRLLPTHLSLYKWESWGQSQKDQKRSLPHYLASLYDEIEHAPTIEQWRRWLRRGEVLLLLDGLDETANHPWLIDELQRAFLIFTRCPTVLTCRTVSFEQHRKLCPAFPVFVLAGLNKQRQKTFINQVAPTLTLDASPSNVVKHFQNAPQIEALASNPLLLSILCSVAARDTELSVTRGALYEKAIETLLSRKNLAKALYPGAEPSTDQKRAVLEQIALHEAITDNFSMSFSEAELDQGIGRTLRPGYGDKFAQWGNALRVDLVQNSGILRSDRQRQYFFLHPAFQEFLTAAALARMINNQGWAATLDVGNTSISVQAFVDGKTWDPRWREVIILLSGQLVKPSRLLDTLIQKKRDDFFRCRLALAASCLPEIPIDRQTSIRNTIDRISTEALDYWLQCDRENTSLALPHFVPALAALGQLNGQSKATGLYSHLCHQLSDRSAEKRAAAVGALQHLGAPVLLSQEVFSAICAASCDPNPFVRARVITTLRRIGTAESFRDAVLDIFKSRVSSDKDGFVCQLASQVVKEFSQLDAVNNLLGTSTESASLNGHPLVSGEMRQERTIPSEVSQTTLWTSKELQELLNNKEEAKRRQGMNMLSQITESSTVDKGLLQALIETALHHGNDAIRSEAIRAIGRLGETAMQHKGAVIALAQILADKQKHDVRIEAVETLGQLGPKVALRKEVMAPLMKALQDEDPELRSGAAETLGSLISQGVRIFQKPWRRTLVKTIDQILPPLFTQQ